MAEKPLGRPAAVGGPVPGRPRAWPCIRPTGSTGRCVLKDVEKQAEFTRRLSEAATDHGHQYNAHYGGKQAERAEQTAASIRQLLATA